GSGDGGEEHRPLGGEPGQRLLVPGDLLEGDPRLRRRGRVRVPYRVQVQGCGFGGAQVVVVHAAARGAAGILVFPGVGQLGAGRTQFGGNGGQRKAGAGDGAGGGDGQRQREPGTSADDVVRRVWLAGHPAGAQAACQKVACLDAAEQIQCQQVGTFGGDQAAE